MKDINQFSGAFRRSYYHRFLGSPRGSERAYANRLGTFAAMNEVFSKVRTSFSCIIPTRCKQETDSRSKQFLPDPKPARTCIQAGKLPGGETSTIEIECIARA